MLPTEICDNGVMMEIGFVDWNDLECVEICAGQEIPYCDLTATNNYFEWIEMYEFDFEIEQR